MDFQQELQKKKFYLLDEFENEDDVLYSELRKQVLQLTAEEEEDDEEHQVSRNNNLNLVTKPKQGHYYNGLCGVSQDGGYYNWPGNKEALAAPAWILNLWRTGNGTGVFIPQIVQSKKKNRPRRKRNGRGRIT